jgi:hypothetical protein
MLLCCHRRAQQSGPCPVSGRHCGVFPLKTPHGYVTSPTRQVGWRPPFAVAENLREADNLRSRRATCPLSSTVPPLQSARALDNRANRVIEGLGVPGCNYSNSHACMQCIDATRSALCLHVVSGCDTWEAPKQLHSWHCAEAHAGSHYDAVS